MDSPDTKNILIYTQYMIQSFIFSDLLEDESLLDDDLKQGDTVSQQTLDGTPTVGNFVHQPLIVNTSKPISISKGTFL